MRVQVVLPIGLVIVLGVLGVLGVLVAAACGGQAAPAPVPPAALGSPVVGRASGLEGIAASFRHVNLDVDDGIVLEISRLDGALVSARPGVMPTFDDPTSFIVRIDSGEVAMSSVSLSNLLNQHVFAYKKAPIKDLEMSIEFGQLKGKGTLHKGVDLPFSMVANVSLTTDGRIRLHPVSVKVLGIPSSGLMKVLGIDLGGLVTLKETSGIEIDGDDFLLSPDRVLASPRIAGRLTAVRIEADRLVEVFGPPVATASLASPDRTAPTFLHFRGGTLRFGRLTMTDADLDIVSDGASREAFDFSLPHYLEQLEAGYSKITASGGLIVHMPSYHPAVAPAAPHRP
jgi:hypothetical protein